MHPFPSFARSSMYVLRGLCLLAACIGYYPRATAVDENTATEESSQKADPATLFEPREYADEAGNVLRYRLLKPKDIDPNQRYPLVVFLHGAGERGSDNVAQLVHGMAEFCKPRRRSQFPCYVIAPQCPKEKSWAAYQRGPKQIRFEDQPTQEMQLLFGLLDQMLEESSIDPKRIFITGLSMGGYGTWDAIYRRPNLFAAAAPICGGGDPSTVSAYSKLPIWCFHGDQDKAVPVEYSRKMIESLKEVGAEPKYTEYAGVGHDSWTQTYAADEFFEWLFAQRRKVDVSTNATQ